MVSSLHKPSMVPQRVGTDITNHVDKLRKQYAHHADIPRDLPHISRLTTALSQQLAGQQFLVKLPKGQKGTVVDNVGLS
jgi:hypothetical protein